MKKEEKRKYIYIPIFVVGIIIFISYTLSQFHSDIQERVYMKQIETMKSISMQGSAVVEKKLGGLVNILYGLAEYVQEEDISNSTNIDKLRNFMEKRDVGFQRLGIADDQGNAQVTNGEKLNIGEREYFQVCMQEKHATTEIRQSDLVDKPICIVAVPILKSDRAVLGVLYGVIELSEFRIYDDTILENKNQYIQIIDMDGNYIRKQASGLIGRKDNIFEGIRSIEGENTADAIRKQIQNDEQVYMELKNEEAHEILYFTPLQINDWCIVTVINYDEVEELVDYILEDDTYIMTLKIVSIIILLCLLIMYSSWKERKRIQEFNEKLVMDEKIVSIAAEKSKFAIMCYDAKSKQLRFINSTLGDMKFPKQVENAPKEIAKYIPDDKDLREQVGNIFENMIDGEERKVSLNFAWQGRKEYLSIQIIPLVDSNGTIRQYIGVMEDSAEEQKLRDKADKDQLTGLYNRSSAMERIEGYLKNANAQPGKVHACMIMDLDNFKTLNDTLGHQMGDQALQDVAEVLKRHFRSYDVVCRLGGDEFLVFMKDIPQEVIGRNISSLLKKLTLVYAEDEKSVEITASAGITIVSELPVDFREMYRKADEALYRVKHERKNDFRIYEQ